MAAHPEMTEKAEIMDARAVSRALSRISFEIIEQNKGAGDLCIVGILTRGAQLAKRIAAKISEIEGRAVEVGVLDITAFRDDLQGVPPQQDKTELPFSIQGKRVVLIDDVIYTGRTARAAVEALIRRGRPKSIQLAVLVDRGHRELPFRADYIGKNLPTSRQEQVRVMLTEPDGMDRVAIFTSAEKEN